MFYFHQVDPHWAETGDVLLLRFELRLQPSEGYVLSS